MPQDLKKYLDAANTAEARYKNFVAQADQLFDAGDTAGALALKGEMQTARKDADEKRDLYQEMLNGSRPGLAQAADPAMQLMPQAMQAAQVQVVRDAADQPFENSGQFFIAVKNAALYPGRSDARLLPMKVQDVTGMSEGDPSSGGYLLTPEVSQPIVEKMYNDGEILARITKDPIGPNSNSIIYNGIDETSRVDGSRFGGVRGYWVAEGGTITATKPKFRQFEVKPKKVAALCYATDEQLKDLANLQSWLGRVVPGELRFKAEDAIFEGDGVGKPLGITKAKCLVSQTRVDASKVTYADVIGMWSRRYAAAKDYVWLINQDVTPQLDSMYLASGIPANFVTYSPEGVMRIKGAPVIESEYCQSLGTIGDIVLASFSQYQAADKGGVEAASSIHVQFVTDETAFRFIYMIDGQPSWGSALTPLHGSNTVSPFVALSTAS